MTVLSGAFTVGSISGGAFNPAVSTGLQLVQCCVTDSCEAFSYIWLYWLSHFGGAALAAGCFLIIHPKQGIKQHTGFDETGETWSALGTASRNLSSTSIPPKVVRTGVDVSRSSNLVSLEATTATASDQLSSQQLL
jgi:hypothetical protein